MKILVIGGGNMGLTYAQSFLRAHIAQASDMMILEKSPAKAADLATRQVGRIYSNPHDCLQYADLIVLAVKPQDTAALFDSLKPLADPQQVYLSIMAGIRMDVIRASLGVTKVIRAMPNLPAQTGMGMTAFTSSEEVTRIELVTVQNLLNTTGKAVYVEDEKYIDAATAISGSGPAYVFYFMNAMIKAAKSMGFSESEAELLVSQTFRGAVDLYSKNAVSCEDWITRVSSKGGTTEAAMRLFMGQQLEDQIIKGIFAARQRAEELGQ